VVAGGAEVAFDAPIERLPLLLVDGRLLPLLDPAIDTLAEEDDEDIVGPDDVADVYDVWGLLTAAAGAAALDLWDGTDLSATWGGEAQGLDDCLAASLDRASGEADLADCGACFLLEEVGAGLTRARLSLPSAGAMTCAGLALDWQSPRRIRWDLWLEE
jgi:hypothetical protein